MRKSLKTIHNASISFLSDFVDDNAAVHTAPFSSEYVRYAKDRRSDCSS